jgi:hypothetical protein
VKKWRKKRKKNRRKSWRRTEGRECYILLVGYCDSNVWLHDTYDRERLWKAIYLGNPGKL